MINNYTKLFLLSILLLIVNNTLWATGEPSTYFNIFVPPNNDAVQRNVCLVVTAIFDNTTFTITDDDMDGDTDDSKSGTLMAGQSYILYIKDNGINDDAQYASGGTLKRDGDYFIITSNNNVYASQSTDSDWQHDWVPGISQSSLSQKFIVYAPKVTSSKRDLNVFAYADSTLVTLRKISLSATTQSGYTNVDYKGGTIIFQRMINRGQDLIHFYPDARNIMDDGNTYVVETSKPTTLQYGALYGNERDGGGYVPTNTGSCTGSLAYFAVPYQVAGDQEIRVVSWDAGNDVKLYRYSAGSWILVKNWNMGEKTFQEWVGKNNNNAAYATVFKIECTAGKRISVFEGNWFETGSPGTSDMATMMSSENGTSAGNYFIAYMAPPGNQANVVNPFTGTAFGGKYTHLYVFAKENANVTIKDAYTNGTDFTKTYSIQAGRYIDCALSETEWKNIYNGTGTIAGGPERPYLIVSSDKPVSVMNSNSNDNWMMYFGSSQFRNFSQTTTTSSTTVIPGQSITIASDIDVIGNNTITNVNAQLVVEGGLQVVSSTFQGNNQAYTGQVTQDGILATVSFSGLPNLSPNGDYQILTTLKGNVMDADGNPILTNNVSDITMIVNGDVNGSTQQSVGLQSVLLNTSNAANLIFDYAKNTGLESVLTDSWTVSTIDYDNDGDDDLFFTDRSTTKPNKLFRNNGNKTFSAVSAGNLTADIAKSMTSTWADYDNDGDLDVVVANNTLVPPFFYVNNGNGTFTKNTSAGFTQKVGYFHHVSWIDVDNDGKLELYFGNYWPTLLNELWKRDANGNWYLWADNLLSQVPGSGTGSTWADYDNDGYQDLLILNNEGGNNRLYHNLGNGNFELVSNAITQSGGNSVASAWGDIDNDGDLDVFISNASDMDNDLFINNGNGQFVPGSGQIVSDMGHSHGATFADVDKDGDLDLFVANDQGTKFLYLNDGSGNFTKKTDEWPTADFGNFYGTAFSDLDLDGDLDLVTATHSNQRNYLYTANNNTNHWINIRLIGTISNRSAIGARIRLLANGKWQTREINSQSGLGGQSSLRQFFGLADAASINNIEITWPSGYVQNISNVNTNQNMVITEPNGAEVTALAYIDENHNCTYDNGETLLKDVKFNINGGDYTAYSDNQGKMSILLVTGSYNISVASNEYTPSCNNPSSFSVQGIGGNVNVGAFALQPVCNNPNLEIKAATAIMRSGFPSKYLILASNKGASASSETTIVVAIPAAINIENASVPWTSMVTQNNQHIITWNLGNVNHGEERLIELFYRVTIALAPGNDVVCQFDITANEADCNTVNNAYTDFQKIFGSIDPNDILAYPEGYNDEHYVSNIQALTYRVRFQNVGNYPAEFVNVIDELPEGLDIGSIRNISSSHLYNMAIEGNKLMFHFPNIQLPDSTTNLEGSNGYVQFTIDQMPGNIGGKMLYNAALIQFDYNEFIKTNNVFHTVMGDDSRVEAGSLVVFPNPADDFTTVSAKVPENILPELSSLSIFRQDGTQIHYELCNTNLLKIDVSALPVGFYVLSAKDLNGKTYSGKLLIER